MWIPRALAQFSSAALMYSGPLSQRMTCGLPRQAMICSSVRITRCEGSERSTSMPSASRLKSSITLSSRMLRPSCSWSCMKSIDQTSLMACGTLSGSGLSRTSRLRGLMRRLSSSCRYIRYTRLWFQAKPLTLRRHRKHSPKPQVRLLSVSRSSHWAIASSSVSRRAS